MQIEKDIIIVDAEYNISIRSHNEHMTLQAFPLAIWKQLDIVEIFEEWLHLLFRSLDIT